MTNTDLAILILSGLIVLLLVFAIALGLGRAGRSSKESSRPAEPAPPEAADADRGDQGPSRRPRDHGKAGKPDKPRDYGRQIDALGDFNARAALVFGDHADERVPQAFDEIYDRINALYESAEARADAWDRDAITGFYRDLLEAARFDGCEASVASAAADVAKIILARYKEQLAEITADPALARAARRHASGAAQRTAQRKQIAADIVDGFSEVFEDIRSIEACRRELEAEFAAFVEATAARSDLAPLARHFGAGFLTARRPGTDAPALVVADTASDEERSATARINEFAVRASEFERRVNALRESILEATEAAKACTIEVATEVNGTSVADLLSELAASGLRLDGYFESVGRRRIDDIRDGIPSYQG